MSVCLDERIDLRYNESDLISFQTWLNVTPDVSQDLVFW